MCILHLIFRSSLQFAAEKRNAPAEGDGNGPEGGMQAFAATAQLQTRI
jgi:hypothetical protein